MSPFYWQLSSWLVAGLTALILFERLPNHPAPIKHRPGSTLPPAQLLVLFLLMAGGLFLRLAFLEEFQDNLFTSDEMIIAVAYVANVIHMEPNFEGSSNLPFALGLHGWYTLFGFSALSARSWTTLIGLMGLPCWFFAVRLWTGTAIAAWSTALAAVSLHGIYFGKLAHGLGTPLLLIPLLILLGTLAFRRTSCGLSLLAGTILGITLFSYPSTHLFLGALGMGLTLAFVWHRWRHAHFPPLPIRPLLTTGGYILLGFLPILLFGLLTHFYIYGVQDAKLFRAGGTLVLSWEVALKALSILLKESLFRTESWYLPYQGIPFFERTLWPLAIAGVWYMRRLSQPWYMWGFLLAGPLVILLVLVSGPYPGMRRALPALIPFHLIAGYGIVALFRPYPPPTPVTHAPPPAWPKRLFKRSSLHHPATPWFLLLLMLAHPILFQLDAGRTQTNWNSGTGFDRAPIPLNYLQTALRQTDVVLEREEFQGYFDGIIYQHYPRMVAYYTHQPIHTLTLVDNVQKLLPSLTQPTLFLSRSTRRIAQLLEASHLCLDRHTLQGDPHIPYQGLLQPTRAGTPPCPTPFVMPKHAGSSMDMAFDKTVRLRHQLNCAGPYCNPERSTFIYTQGGEVTFRLTPPPHSVPITLRLTVAGQGHARETLVFVNEDPIGTLSQAQLIDHDRAEFAVPPQHGPSEDDWTIRLLPSPSAQRPGWDIVRAELLAKTTDRP